MNSINKTMKISIRFVYNSERFPQAIDNNQGYIMKKAPTDGYLIQANYTGSPIIFINLKQLSLARKTREDGCLESIRIDTMKDY